MGLEDGIVFGAGSYTTVAVIALIAVLALGCAFVLRRQVLAAPDGTTKMQDIAQAVQEGASAYLKRQFRTLVLFAVVVFGLLFLLPGDSGIRIGRSVAFVFGAGFSAAIGYLGMWLAVRANVRVAAAATRPGGRAEGARIAFRTGGVVGMSVVGLGLLGAALVVLVYDVDAPGRARGLRLRCRTARHVHARGWWHLHQGGRRRRRPGRQGREGHPGGRPPQRRHHRGQRGRQRRRLCRYGRRPLRVLCGDPRGRPHPGQGRDGRAGPRVPADRHGDRRLRRAARRLHHPDPRERERARGDQPRVLHLRGRRGRAGRHRRLRLPAVVVRPGARHRGPLGRDRRPARSCPRSPCSSAWCSPASSSG